MTRRAAAQGKRYRDDGSDYDDDEDDDTDEEDYQPERLSSRSSARAARAPAATKRQRRGSLDDGQVASVADAEGRQLDDRFRWVGSYRGCLAAVPTLTGCVLGWLLWGGMIS